MIPRSWLYVPGHRADRIAKALQSDADAVIIDLEDAVPSPAKEAALENAVAALESPRQDRHVWVRLNPLDTPWSLQELESLGRLGRKPDGVRIAKAGNVEAITRAAEVLACDVHLLIETATALRDAAQLAGAHPRITGLALGEADLAADLRVSPEGLEWARGWIVTAARSHGLASPVQSVYTDVADLDGLRRSSLQGRRQGFFGRTVIHPRQIDVVNHAFTPTPEEVARAENVVTLARTSAEAGETAVLDSDGRFIDPAVVENARLILDLAIRD
jgi:citrate lyase subunit beta/citryl-CoA lyase